MTSLRYQGSDFAYVRLFLYLALLLSVVQTYELSQVKEENDSLKKSVEGKTHFEESVGSEKNS